MNKENSSDNSVLELENALSLEVSEFTPQEITTNARLVLEKIKEFTASFNMERYEGREDRAKIDRASINKLIKIVKDKKSATRKRWLAPLEDFERNCDAIVKEFETAAEIPDAIVKELKRLADDKRRVLIEGYWKNKDFNLVPIERLFNPKWLNKTTKLEDIYAEIDQVITGIYSDIKTLEGLSGHMETAKAMYLETLDIATTIRKVEALKENEVRLEKEKAGRKEREEKEAEAAIHELEVKPVETAIKEKEAASLADAALDNEPPQVYTFTFRFTATAEKCRQLRKFMLENGIEYEKVDMSLYELRSQF